LHLASVEQTPVRDVALPLVGRLRRRDSGFRAVHTNLVLLKFEPGGLKVDSRHNAVLVQVLQPAHEFGVTDLLLLHAQQFALRVVEFALRLLERRLAERTRLNQFFLPRQIGLGRGEFGARQLDLGLGFGHDAPSRVPLTFSLRDLRPCLG